MDKDDLRNGKLSLISRSQIVTKGFCLEYEPPMKQFDLLMKSAGLQNLENSSMGKRTYVMAMGTFEHD